MSNANTEPLPSATDAIVRLSGKSAEIITLLRTVSLWPAVRLILLVVLLTEAAVKEAWQISAFASDEIWIHLRTGTWILQNHGIPRTALFSQLSGVRWIDFNWAYDAVCGAAYAWLGLRAVPLLVIIFKMALAAITFLLAGGRRNFWRAAVLTVLAELVLNYAQPLPTWISICFFGLALHRMIEARRQGDAALLLWLPPLFWLWANVDAQFIVGLLLLCIFVIAETAESTLLRRQTWSYESPRLARVLAIAATCLIATQITPYSIHLIPAAIRSSYSATLFKNFAVMGAMSFRRPEHFVLTLLVFSACMVLGRQGSHDIFTILLLTLGAALAFRVQRDNWVIVLASIAILGDFAANSVNESTINRPQWPRRAPLYVFGAVVGVLAACLLRAPSNQMIEARLTHVLPARACDFIQTSHFPGPLFNDYGWGGYLMWKIPEYPVFIDERIDLYGDDFSEAYFEVIMGKQRMETLQGFASQKTILLPASISMAKALTTIPVLQQQFREIYRDELAIVFVRRDEQGGRR